MTYYSNKIDLSHYASLRFKSLPWKVVSNSNDGFLSNISRILPWNNAIEIPWKMTCSKMNIPYYFKVTERFKRTETTRYKVIASLNTTISIYTHRVRKIINGVEKEYLVSSDIGVVHHYRTPLLNGTYIHSTVIKKFVNRVMPEIEKQVC